MAASNDEYTMTLQLRHAVESVTIEMVLESFELAIKSVATIESLVHARYLETASMQLKEIVRIEPSRMNKTVKPAAGQDKPAEDEDLAEINRILNERRAKNTSRQSLA